jgi:hypothetical protein
MTEMTALDQAHAAMQDDPDNAQARLNFYEKLSACEVFLMLDAVPEGEEDTVSPTVFELDSGSFVLAFDREERLAAFSGDTTPYVALSGRALAEMLSGQGIGLGLNLEVAPSSMLLPAEAIDWLHRTLGRTPDQVEAGLSELHAPAGLPEHLVSALDARLAAAMGLAKSAYLVGVTYETGGKGHLLAIIDAIPDAEAPFTQIANEALAFSGIEAGAMDVAFFRSDETITQKLDAVGLRFELPQLQENVTVPGSAPGMDPDKPPKLK